MKPHNYALNLRSIRLKKESSIRDNPCVTELVALLACWRTQGVDNQVCSVLQQALAMCSQASVAVPVASNRSERIGAVVRAHANDKSL